MEELKPVRCGCGGKAEIVNRLSIDYGTNVWYVICRVCHIASEDYFSEAEAIEARNKAMGATAEPERKKGEWVKEDLSGYLTPGGNSIYHCSECGHTGRSGNDS